MLKYKEVLAGSSGYGFVFFILEDGMGAFIDIKNRVIRLEPLADLRTFDAKATEEEIRQALDVFNNPVEIRKGILYEYFYDNEEFRNEVLNGARYC